MSLRYYVRREGSEARSPTGGRSKRTRGRETVVPRGLVCCLNGKLSELWRAPRDVVTITASTTNGYGEFVEETGV